MINFNNQTKRLACNRLWVIKIVLVLSVAVSPFLMASAVNYYVNDASTASDTYTSAIGNDSNSGLTPGAPKLTITNLLATYSLLPGDTFYIDTGTYNSQFITLTNSGAGTNRIIIMGSTNLSIGGSIIDRKSGSANPLTLLSANNITISHLTLRGGLNGFGMASVTNVLVEHVYSASNNAGFFINGSSAVFFRRCAAIRNSTGVSMPSGGPNYWDNSVSWSNVVSFNVADNFHITNSVIVGGVFTDNKVPRTFNYSVMWELTSLAGSDTLSEYIAATTNAGNLVIANPQFASPISFDFHPQSVVGRFNPATMTRVTDSVHSVLIDFGDPSRTFTTEPNPSGNTINSGMYGNHPEASMSRTNPWFFAFSYNDGGFLIGTGRLAWTYGAVTNGTLVNLQFSINGGTIWSNIITGYPVTNRSYNWLATNVPASLNARWRVQNASQTSIWDACDSNFVLKPNTGSVFTAYVNDASTVGDVYCSAAGSGANDGLTPSSPLLQLTDLLDRYNFGPGDRIFVDTGLYTSGVVIRANDAGAVDNHMIIIGSTNVAAGGSVIIRSLFLDAIELEAANNITISYLTIRNSRYGINFNNTHHSEVHHVNVVGCNTGFRGVNASSNEFLHCAAVSNLIGVAGFTLNNHWDYGVSYSNDTAFILSTLTSMSVSNSVIVGGTAFSGAGVPTYGDFNLFQNTTINPSFLVLDELQKSRNAWWNCTYGDPLFANPAALDFHVRSETGRYDPATKLFVNDAQTSILVDFGDPARAGWTNEPLPNASRVNAGRYGSTVEASKSRSNVWLQVLSFNDGGQLSVPSESVYWTTAGAPTGATIRIEFSSDEGGSWFVIATNIAAHAGSYLWTNTNFPSSRFSRWRIVYEANTNILSTVATNFTFRNGPFVYYVNDSSTAGDVYTLNPGSSTNLGTSSLGPRSSLNDILLNYDLDPSDIIYVDTGIYASNIATTITSLDSGIATNPVRIIGSTNFQAGGSVLRPSTSPGSGLDGLVFNAGSGGVEVKNLTLTGWRNGIALASASNLVFERITLLTNRSHGVSISGGSFITMRNSAVDRNLEHGINIAGGGSIRVASSVLWNNQSNAVRIVSGSASISNSILGTFRSGEAIYRVPNFGAISADYNGYYWASNAVLAISDSIDREIDSVGAWSFHSSQDHRSLQADPLFANANAGDFHLKTEAIQGRLDYALGLVNDSVSSPMIDAGNPAWTASAEPSGGTPRVNIGMFGNTTEASKGLSTPRLYAASHAISGWVRGTSILHWVAGNLSTSETVVVEYSRDGGYTWSIIASGTAASVETVSWNTTSASNSPAGVWRVRGILNGAVMGQTTNFFGIRNGPLNIFINDTSIANDIYTTAAGSPTNWVSSSSSPLNSLVTAVDRFDLEPGDQIFVDSGTYTGATAVTFQLSDSGGATSGFIHVRGVGTCGGETILRRSTQSSGQNVLTIDTAKNMTLSNITFASAFHGVTVRDASNVQLASVRSRNHASHGIQVFNSFDVRIQNSASYANAGVGFISTSNSPLKLLSSVSTLNNSNGINIVAGTTHITNSVMTATGSGNAAVQVDVSAILRSDYNNYFVSSSANIATRGTVPYRNLFAWQFVTENDKHTLTHNPGFALAAAGDFHPFSEVGRFDQGTCLVVTDSVGNTSALIDAGDPAFSVGSEPSPNGNRINIGLHGGTVEASRSRTNAWILVLTLNDGGITRGTNALYWVAGGAATSQFVSIDYSGDNGVTWTNIATNIAASTGAYLTWDSTGYGSSPLARWRVVSQVNSNATDMNDTPFILSNGSIQYYVNDNSTNGDVYSTSPGSVINDGLSPATPLASINAVLSLYELAAGDVVYVDTGEYTLTQNLLINESVRGTSTNLIYIRGSTNFYAGGTHLDRLNGSIAINIRGTEGVALENLNISRAVRGLVIEQSTNCLIRNVAVKGPNNISEGVNLAGVSLDSSRFIQFVNCAIRSVTNIGNAAGLQILSSESISWESGVSWSNGVGIRISTSSAIVSNSFFQISPNGIGMAIGLGSTIRSDYNNFYHPFGGLVAEGQTSLGATIQPLAYENIHTWSKTSGNDIHSLSHDPRFFDPNNGDFHLLSRGGRYLAGGVYTQDVFTSDMIDAGPPGFIFTNEPSPNGSRINIGSFGNTGEASLSPTNASLTVITFNDGGIASGAIVPLYWVARGGATSLTLSIDISVSPNSGWSNVVSGLNASTGVYNWNSTLFTSTVQALWRLVGDSDTSVVAQTHTYFAIRNQFFNFYINDTNTLGDIYSTAPGAVSNNGLSPASPMISITNLFANYDLESGDVVYWDTGVYNPAGPAVIRQPDTGAGTPGGRVLILGSTNNAEGGTRLLGRGIEVVAAQGLELRDIIVDKAGVYDRSGLSMVLSTNVVVTNIQVYGSGTAFDVSDSVSISLNRSVGIGAATNGLAVSGSLGVLWNRGVLISNKVGLAGFNGVVISSSVFVATTPDSIVYRGNEDTFISDYNNIFVTNNALVAEFGVSGSLIPVRYADLGRWSNARGTDRHSLSVDPRFAGTTNIDLHLKSTAGRFDPLTGTSVTDAVSSLLIDAGNPADNFSLEPLPNGGRVNIGRYGNTLEASLSTTNPYVHAASLNNGGVVNGTNVLLYWVAGGSATSHGFRLDYSSDDGITWSSIATGVPSGTFEFTFNTTNYLSSPIARWRVVSLVNSNIFDVTDSRFILRNGPLSYYVNNGATTGDVYSTAPGVSTNHGATPAQPLPTLQAVINSFDLEPGDVVYVDTGVYTLTNSIALTSLDAGVIFKGSTNVNAGGSVILGADGFNVFSLVESPGTQIRHLTIKGGNSGVFLDFNSSGCLIEWCRFENGKTGISAGQGGGNLTVRHTVIKHQDTAALSFAQAGLASYMDACILWSNTADYIVLQSSILSMSNSIVAISGTNQFMARLDSISSFSGDYNAYWIRSGNRMVTKAIESVGTLPAFPLIYENLSRWAAESGHDRHSLAENPLFVDAAVGNFHLRSAGGTFNQATSTFTNFTETSRLIDAGLVIGGSFTNETAPNGARRNIGLYGNTSEASRTPTNGQLTVVSLRDGGYARGSSWPLFWNASGSVTGHTVKIEFSPNQGITWQTIITNVPATVGSLFWNTTTHTSTWLGVWRVMSEANTNIVDRTSTNFAVRNQSLPLYVNNNSTFNDVYCTAIGDALNDGTTPATPKLSLDNALSTYDLEPGDIIYVDTGVYTVTAPITIDRFDAWNDMTNLNPLVSGTNSITIQGSTNVAAGGSRLLIVAGIDGISMFEALGVQFRDLILDRFPVGVGSGFNIDDSSYSKFSRVISRNASIGFNLIDSDFITFEHSEANGNKIRGVSSDNSNNGIWNRGVLWNNKEGAYVARGTFAVRNTAIGALYEGAFGLVRNDKQGLAGILGSDYNNIYTASNGATGVLITDSPVGGGSNVFLNLNAWVQRTGQDVHSFSQDPKFANVGANDFHPQSPGGRFVAGFGYFTNAGDAISPLIDTGDPAISFSSETQPNGGRANVGRYSNTPESSLTPTNGTIVIGTFNDGGSSEGFITLRWTPVGAATNDLVYFDFSSDGGATWTNIATNVSANTGQYVWDSIPYGRAAAGLWRIISQDDSKIASTNNQFFALRNGGSIPYYVNDSVTNNDVYCTGPGLASNNGYLPQTPKNSIQALVDAVDLEPGDIVYVDTGSYVTNVTTVISQFDSGGVTNPVIFQGSTNIGAGGTVLDRITRGGAVVRIFQAENIIFRDMRFVEGSYGAETEQSLNCRFERVRAEFNNNSGFLVNSSQGIEIKNCLVVKNGTNAVEVMSGSAGPGNVTIRNSTLWDNPSSIMLNADGSAQIYNSILYANGVDQRVLLLNPGAGTVLGDYNNYYRLNGALVGERVLAGGASDFYPTLSAWQSVALQELHSLSHDPLFINTIGGDFHVASGNGRFLDNGSLIISSNDIFSPVIDAGDPATNFMNEASPRGPRINLGRYGNTDQASLSRTNAWLLALTYNDGGFVSGTNRLRWIAGGFPSNGTVRVEFANNGVLFSLLASNLPVYSVDGFVWDASQEPLTALAKWRVVSEADSLVQDENDRAFVIKNQAISLYFNDGSTIGDIYTFAPGSSTNSGTSPFDPHNDPSVLLDLYPLSGGDAVFIDTGSYSLSVPAGIFIGQSGDFVEQGVAGLPITVLGSTNYAAGGSIITGVAGTNGALATLRNTSYVNIGNLRLTGAKTGLNLLEVENVHVSNVVSFSQTSHGFVFNNAAFATVFRSVSYANAGQGISLGGGDLNITIRSCVVWSNNGGGIINSSEGAFSVFNSILHSTRVGEYVIATRIPSSFNGQYNMYWYGTSGGRLALDNGKNIFFQNLRSWQRASGSDTYSMVIEPEFVSPATGDFHLRSQQGRYFPTADIFVQDASTSWAIDTADPLAAFNQETSPNGSRLNLGLYGNTTQASKSLTNTAMAQVRIVTMSDGGFIGPTQELFWLSRAVPASEQFYIEFSDNNGIVWQPVVSNIPASQTSYTWLAPTSTPLAVWRIISTTNPGLGDTLGTNFTIRLGPIPYYVNDTNLTGDIYTLATGSVTNNGLTPSTPVDDVRHIFDRYDLEPGDMVLIDNGYYPVTNTITIGAQDSGATNANLLIIGNPDRFSHGGTRFKSTTTNAFNGTNPFVIFDFVNGEGASISHLTFDNADVAIRFNRQNNSSISNVLIRNGGTAGLSFDSTINAKVSRSVLTRNAGSGISVAGSVVRVDSSIIWSNGNFGATVSGGSLSLSNTIISAFGPATNVCVNISAGSLVGDYNNYFRSGNARYVSMGGLFFDGLPQWVAFSTQEVHTLSVDPLFADPVGDDYHLRSPAGRYDPLLSSFVTTDTVFSVLIDTSATNLPFSFEPEPNGDRRNIGLFGDSIEASKSRTNEWLLAITAMAGGRVQDIFKLVWTSGNIDSTNRVRLDYSIDGGLSWMEVVSDVPISDSEFTWDSRAASPNTSPIAKWRVVMQANTNIYDETDTTFGLNGPFLFYVNDSFLTDDIYTVAFGASNNLGVVSNAPKPNLQNVLDVWDLEPGDTILIDSGYYYLGSNDVIQFTRDDQGNSELPVNIIGSTNGIGTWIGVPSLGDAHKFMDFQGSFIHMRNIGLMNGSMDLAGTNFNLSSIRGTNFSFELIGPEGRVSNVVIKGGGITVGSSSSIVSRVVSDGGFIRIFGSGNRLENSLLSGSASPLLLSGGTNVLVINNTIVSRNSAFSQIGQDSSTVLQNNILIANAESNEAFCILNNSSGILISDYNNFVTRNGAWVGNANGNWEKLLYWQRESGQDTHSLAHDPLFANEAGSDFHLKSIIGRYSGGGFVSDAVDSPLIDAGSPFSFYDNEPVPNGNRVNIGAYGNTGEASKSPIFPTLTAVTMNDGGVIRGTNTIRWIDRNMTPIDTVRIQYSPDAGTTWTNVVSGLSAQAGEYAWNTTLFQSSLTALWRIVLESDTNITDVTDNLFALRNNTLTFYVNDASLGNDVYTSAIGSNTNDGLSSSSPKADLGSILDTYDLEEGDLVLVDSGTYTNTQDILVWSDGGSVASNLYIRGSTNPTIQAGTLISRGSKAPGSDALEIRGSHITIENMNVSEAYRGIYILSNTAVTVDNLFAYSNSFGVVVQLSSSGVVRNVRGMYNNLGSVDVITSRDMVMRNMTLIINSNFGVRVSGMSGNNYIGNSIFYIDAPGVSNTVSALSGNTVDIYSPNMFIDYNVYYFAPSTTLGRIYSTYTNLTSWQRDRARDYRSSITNPLLANINTANLHLKSAAGRYQPGTGWVFDVETSWAIDKGDPNMDFSLEPFTNGERINIGAFGNTPLASVGSTNMIVYGRVLNEPVNILTTNDTPYPLIWHALNQSSSLVVRVQYSGDGGTEWVDLATNVNIYREFVLFDLAPIYNSFDGRWRIVGMGADTNVYDTNDGTIKMYFAPVFRISNLFIANNQVNFIFPGAWNEDYVYQRATPDSFSLVTKDLAWTNVYSTPTNLVLGGPTLFKDTTPFTTNFLYRVIWLGTNGLPFQ